jgi:hypothetical protein
MAVSLIIVSLVVFVLTVSLAIVALTVPILSVSLLLLLLIRVRLWNCWHCRDVARHLEDGRLRLAKLYHGSSVAQLGRLVSPLKRLLVARPHRLLERVSFAVSRDGVKVGHAGAAFLAGMRLQHP